MDDDSEAKNIKIILIGETGTGKTNLINVYFDIGFNPNSAATLTPESCSKELKIKDNDFIINIWDTAGQERYRSMTKIFIKGAKIVIFVYDVTNQDSFKELKFWVSSTEQILGKEAGLGLVGNKVDLFDKQVVSSKEGEKFANEIGALFRETSAKEDPNGFKNFVKDLVEDFLTKKGIIEKEGEKLKLDVKQKKKKCSC